MVRKPSVAAATKNEFRTDYGRAGCREAAAGTTLQPLPTPVHTSIPRDMDQLILPPRPGAEAGRRPDAHRRPKP